ncbi:MAG TPA: hypothetical protein VGI19_15865 [Candidatus Cybelea sp.]|jgi:hypothetical protein
MNKQYFALALALSVLPISAAAQTANTAPAPPTAQQREQMRQTFEQFKGQEEQLHQQLRSTILSDLTPIHRRAIAAEIGELAVSPNPDPQATAKRIDSILSPGERSRIISAHENYRNQEEQLHQQMFNQIKSQFPNAPQFKHHDDQDHDMAQKQMEMRDAGWIVLHSLPPHHDMGMMGMGPHH